MKDARGGLVRSSRTVIAVSAALPRHDPGRQPRTDPRHAANGQRVDRSRQHAVRVRRGAPSAWHRGRAVRLPGPARHQLQLAREPACADQPPQPEPARFRASRSDGLRTNDHRMCRQAGLSRGLLDRKPTRRCRQAGPPICRGPDSRGPDPRMRATGRSAGIDLRSGGERRHCVERA